MDRARSLVRVCLAALLFAAVLAPAGATRAAAGIADVVGANARRLPGGHYEITLRDGRTLRTHGGDPMDALPSHGIDIGSGDAERDPACATDYYQHVLYGYRTGSANRYSSVVARIRSSMKRVNAVLDEEAQSSGSLHGDYKVKCDAGNVIAVGQFSAAASDFETIVNAASAAGYGASNADYTIFWDADRSGYCGVGSYYASDSPLITNPNNNGGGYGISYLSCWDSRTPMHENGHNQGAVQAAAPDSTGTGGHCNDTYDVMCYAPDGGNKNQTEILTCVDRMHYDCGNDSYFDAATESGEWLASHWNIGSSVNRFIQFSSIAPQPGASVAPSSLAYGNQATGTTSAAKSVTLTSTGQADLVVGTASLTGVNAAEFAIASDGCSGRTLAPAATCTVSVTFSPVAAGAKTAALSIPHNATGSPSTVALSGSGVAPAPAVTLTPSSLPFGSRTTGTTSPSQTSTLTNTGSAPLVAGTLSLGGTNASQFQMTETCSGATIAPGGTCGITVVYAPAATGAHSASVSIPSNASGSPNALPLSGTGVPPGPAVTFSPSSLAFGNVIAGSSSSKTVTVTNTGTAALTVTQVSLSGSADFSIASQTCTAASIPVGGTCTAGVVYAPPVNGVDSGLLLFTTNAAGSPQSVPLSGSGAPQVTFSPLSLGFGAGEVGQQSAARTVTLTNNSSSASLSIGSLGLGGSQPGEFAIASQDCVGTVAPGASCSVGVIFQPQKTGPRTATLLFGTSPVFNYPLSGTGVDTRPPTSTFTTQDGEIKLLNHGVSFLTDNKVLGSSTDAGTILKVEVTFTHVVTRTKTIRTITGQGLSCGIPQTCSWEALVPTVAGLYNVNVRATDTASPANTENPGPEITIYVV